jgi:ribosome maturation factor RimP
MDIENIIYKLRRALDRRIQQLAISVSSGGVDNMNTYKYITGQINALEAVKQEISNLLDEKEPYDANTNIVEIPKGNSTTKPKT